MQDDFNLDDFENNDEEITNKDRLNNVLCYVPFVNIGLLFVEKYDTKEATKKYSRQWITIFLLFFISMFVVAFLWFTLSFFFFIGYVGLSVFLAAKAYNGMYVEIEFIEKIIEQFHNKNEPKKK